MSQEKFNSFREFYAFYLTLHRHKTNRILHFCATTIVLLIIFNAIITREYFQLIFAVIISYALAFIGNHKFEKSELIIFKYPFFNLMAEFLMWWQLLTRRIYF